MKTLFKRPALFGAVLVAIAVMAFGAACSDSGPDEATKNATTVSSINILDNAGLHGMDTSINQDKKIPANAQTTIQKLQTVLLVTKWPTDDLQNQAKTLAGIMNGYAAAVGAQNPDLAKAGELANKAHEGEHDFSHAVWDYLYGQAGVKAGSSGGGE